jgi:hypothetical protein
MMQKEEILDLLRKGDFAELFEELENFFKRKDDRLNALIDEYINRSGIFNMAEFMSRLRVFINRNYNLQLQSTQFNELDYYDALCELDFKLQTHYFQRIYKHKKIAAFLLHGETDELGSDIRWLYNQLLYKEGLSKERPIVIDFSSKLGGSFGRLLEEFFIAFQVDTETGNPTRHIARLRSQLENRLKVGHFVCIIKSPECLLGNKGELCKLFNDFLTFLDDHIVQEDPRYGLIFLFIEEKLVDYHCLEAQYFISFNEENKKNYSSYAVNCRDLKIIDLAPISKIKESDITDWIEWSLLNRELYEKTRLIAGREKEILQEGNNPYQVIQKICKELNIEIEKRWIA